MKRIITIFLSFTLIFLLSASLKRAPQQNYLQVLQNVDLHLGGMIPGIAWNIHLENFEDDKLKNDVQLFVEASTLSDQRFALVTFLQPKKFEGQKLLIRANNMWFTKKGLNQPLAISGRQRLSGSAANADVASASYSIDYNVGAVKEEKFENEDCYVFDLEAKNNLVSYARIKLYVTKAAHTAVKAEYYGKSNDRMIKHATFEYKNAEVYKSAKTAFASKISIFDQVDLSNKTVMNISTIHFPSFENSKFDKNNL